MQVVLIYIYKMEQGDKEALLPGCHGQEGTDQHSASRGGAPGRPTSPEALQTTSRGSRREIISLAFLSHQISLSRPLLPGARPGGNVSRNSQAAHLSPNVRHSRQEGLEERTVNPPVRWRDVEEASRLQVPGTVPFVHSQHQQSPLLAPRLPEAHKEGWAAAATARA